MKRWWWVLGGVVALAVVLVVGDRIAVTVAQNAAVSSLEQEADDVSGAELSIHGFPFLTQVLGGSLDHVTGSADAATFSGYEITDLRVDAHGVETSDPYVVEDGTVSGMIAVSSLQTALNESSSLPLELSTEGSMLVATLDVLGLDVSANLQPRVDGDAIVVDVESVQLGPATVTISDLPGALSERLSDLQIPLDLPAGIALDDVSVFDGSVLVTAQGHDVALAELAAS